MSDLKISDLPVAASSGPDDISVIVQNGVTKRVSFNRLAITRYADTQISVDDSNAFQIVGNSVNSIGLSISNVAPGGHNFSLGVSGASGPTPAGSLFIYDNTVGSARAYWNGGGALVQRGDFYAFGNAQIVGSVSASFDGAAFDGTPTASVFVSTKTSGAGAAGAAISFLRQGLYGIKLGLDTNNSFVLGGFSMGTGLRVYWDVNGNQVTTGSVAQNSDIRFKKDFTPIVNVIAKLLAIDAFSYTDTDTDERRIGVSAQSVQSQFAEGVLEDSRGRLSVAYGSIALAALVEYAKAMEVRMLELENRLAALQ